LTNIVDKLNAAFSWLDDLEASIPANLLAMSPDCKVTGVTLTAGMLAEMQQARFAAIRVLTSIAEDVATEFGSSTKRVLDEASKEVMP